MPVPADRRTCRSTRGRTTWHARARRGSRAAWGLGESMGKPTFGIFDHIEDIPGTPTPQLLQRSTRSDQDGRRSGLRRVPPRRAPRVGSVHGTEPGGVHRGRVAGHEEHPPRADGEAVAVAPSGADHRRHVRRRQPDERPPRLRCRPRRRTHRALLVRQQLARVEGSVRRRPRHHLRRLRDGRDQQRELEVLRLPDDPDVDQAGAEPDPVLVSGQPGHRRSPRHEPDVARARSTRPRTTSTSRRGTPTRATPIASTGPSSVPRVGCTMVLAIAPTEDEALEHRPSRHGRACPPGPQRPQARSPGAAGRRVRCGPRTAARHHGPHGGRHPLRCRDRRRRSRTASPASSRPASPTTSCCRSRPAT